MGVSQKQSYVHTQNNVLWFERILCNFFPFIIFVSMFWVVYCIFFMFLFSYYKLHTHFQNWGYKGCIDAQEVGKKSTKALQEVKM